MQTEKVSRYEKKYIINSAKFEKLYASAAENLTPDMLNSCGNTYTICDLYCKIEQNMPQSIITSPAPRTNICIRSYGVPAIHSNVYLEIKDNDNGKITKTRTKISLYNAYKAIEGDFNFSKPDEVLKRIEFLRSNGKIIPELYIAYDRYAFSGSPEQDIRITFDTNIRSRVEGLRLEQGDYAPPILPDGSFLMEIKTNKAYPLWLTVALAKCNLFCGSRFLHTAPPTLSS